jgi:hypothetical protein
MFQLKPVNLEKKTRFFDIIEFFNEKFDILEKIF